MKVLLINGSPKEKGCTYTALCEVAKALNEENIDTEIFHIGNKPIRGCMGCGNCAKTQSGRCVFHYAAASGAITSFLDRAFYAGKKYFEYKPGAAIVSCRRAGSTATLEQLNKYFTISNMPLVSSLYWCMVHGNTPEEVVQDLEGMQIMRTLGKNMAWLLKCIKVGEANNINIPKKEAKVKTNFIR